MNKKNIEETTGEQSTIFTEPEKINDSRESIFKKPAVKAVCILLVLAIAAAASYIVIKVIPDKKDGKDINSKISATSVSIDSVESVTRITPKGETRFYREANTSAASSSRKYNWYIEGIEKEKTEDTAVYNFVKLAAELKGVKQKETKDSVYGFDKSECTVNVSGSEKQYSIILGNQIGKGRYAKITGSFSGVYIIDSSAAEIFLDDEIAFVNITPYSAAKFSTDISAYKNSGGKLERFDTLTVSGKNYPEPMVFTMNGDALMSDTDPYIMISPKNARAVNVENFLILFTGTLGVDGAYSFYDSAEYRSEFGLDDPDITVTLSVGGEEKSFSFKAQEEGLYAAVGGDVDMIRKVKAENLLFIGTTVDDYCNINAR